MKKILVTLIALLAMPSAYAAGRADPLLTMIKIDQLEYRDAETPWAWDADVWLGQDLHKLVFKTEGQKSGSETEEAEVQVLYRRALYPYWDWQVGWRRDLNPTPERDWLAVGLSGVAPYFFEVDASLFMDEDGQVAARLDAEYEILFTQRLILSPEVELNLYTQDDEHSGVDAGLVEASAGLRLRYEVRREFAPYVGVEYSREKNAPLHDADGDDEDKLLWLVGIRAWY